MEKENTPRKASPRVYDEATQAPSHPIPNPQILFHPVPAPNQANTLLASKAVKNPQSSDPPPPPSPPSPSPPAPTTPPSDHDFISLRACHTARCLLYRCTRAASLSSITRRSSPAHAGVSRQRTSRRASGQIVSLLLPPPSTGVVVEFAGWAALKVTVLVAAADDPAPVVVNVAHARTSTVQVSDAWHTAKSACSLCRRTKPKTPNQKKKRERKK